MFFMSGSQAYAFALAAQTMTERIRQLGPNPLRVGRVQEGVSDPVEPDLEEERFYRGRR
jgi:hypothetical protein